MIFKEYLETQEFASIAGITTKTVGRLKKELLSGNSTTKKIKCGKKPYKYHHSLLKRFLSPEVYKILMENKSLRNTIRCVKETDTLAYKLFQLDWTWWCTVAYQKEFSEDQCREKMDKFYDHLAEKFGAETNLRMFYTTESFDVRQGHHNHFVVSVSDPKLHYLVKTELQTFMVDDRVEVQRYDAELPCIFYSTKEGTTGTGWDLHGNNLKADGLRYAS